MQDYVMKCEEFDINLAENVRLFAPIKFGSKIYEKGHALTKEDILIFKMHDVRRIFGAVMDDGDISYQTALGIIAAKLCGDNSAYTIDEQGICRIISTVNGIFVNNEDRVAKFNRLHPNIILNTIEPYSQVKEGEVIAALELTLPIIPQAEVDDLIFRLSGNSELISTVPFAPLKVGLIYAKVQDTKEETRHFTNVVKRLVKEFASLQLDFIDEFNAAYDVEAVADALQNALNTAHDIIFILGGAPTSCESDVLPAAINKIVDEIVSQHIPQIGASDLLIAEKRKQKIIVLPYDYDKADISMINRYIKQAIYADKLNKFDFSRHQSVFLANGGKLDAKYKSSLIMAHNQGNTAEHANVGAVVLAAGIGSRSGRNKLMVETKDGLPLFMHAVNAAIRSEASPVFVVTGYHDAEMQEILENIDVNILYNPAYRSGIKTSIALGLKSIPSFCEGAVIIPADMPNIMEKDINLLIASFKRGQEKQLCMFTHHGQKSNPVLWGSALFDKADIVPENAMIRPVFMEHSDYTNLVEISDDNKFLDVNFPSDVEQIAKPRED